MKNGGVKPLNYGRRINYEMNKLARPISFYEVNQ